MPFQNYLYTMDQQHLLESLNNPNFKGVEFDTFMKEAGLNRFNMTPRKWIEATNAIGIVSKAGRNGGTYAHKDIAFNFGMWISPQFKIFLIKEFQRLKEEENSRLKLEWNLQRTLAKVNYHIHTEAERLVELNKTAITQMKTLIAHQVKLIR